MKHVERTRALLHLVTIDPREERDPISDYRALRHELTAFDSELAQRPELVALSKSDLPDVRDAHPELRARFRDELGVELHLLSSVTGDGIDTILQQLLQVIRSEST